MKHIALALLLLGACSGISAMDNTVTLPCQKEISKRLRAIGVNHFVEKIKIDKKLADKQVHPTEVVVFVQFALIEYENVLNYPSGPQKDLAHHFMQMKQPKIISSILQDHPEAIELLKNNGLLEK